MSTFHCSAYVKALLCGKFVVIIGDSIQRGIYKDLVLLLQEDRYLEERALRCKGEESFHNDKLIKFGEKDNSLNYVEAREYKTSENHIQFYFVTRCYNSYVKSILEGLKMESSPDIVIMNSCLWDISRYSDDTPYERNLYALCQKLREILSSKCLVIWNTALPIAPHARGGFLSPKIQWRVPRLNYDIGRANYIACRVFSWHGFDILHLDDILRDPHNERATDGIHWKSRAHRHMTSLLIDHISRRRLGEQISSHQFNNSHPSFSHHPNGPIRFGHRGGWQGSHPGRSPLPYPAVAYPLHSQHSFGNVGNQWPGARYPPPQHFPQAYEHGLYNMPR